jgi:hypothetical protein
VSIVLPLSLARTSLSKKAIVLLTALIATSMTHLVSITKDTDLERGALYPVGLMTFGLMSTLIAAAVISIIRRKGR